MDDERCKQHERFRAIDAAFKAGDLAALRAIAGADDRFPDEFHDLTIGPCLPYAIYHGPLSLIRALLDLGADPNIDSGDGFPPLVAAMSVATPGPGATLRRDALEVLDLLLSHGADPDRRGINDYTPLHWAAGNGDVAAIDLLLAAGADPSARTRIDDLETAAEVAARAGHQAAADRLRAATRSR